MGDGGTFTAGYLLVDTDPLEITGGASSVFELTSSVSGCTDERWLDPDAAGGGAGTPIGDPWNSWDDGVEAHLVASGDCVYFDRASTLSITGQDLVGAGTGGAIGAYGTGATPILSLPNGEQFDVDNDVSIYEMRIEWGAAAPVTTLFAPFRILP